VAVGSAVIVVVAVAVLSMSHSAGRLAKVIRLATPSPAPAGAELTNELGGRHAPVPLPHGVGGNEWALKALRAGQLWEHSGGAGIKIAVLDTGIDYSDPDLAGAAAPGSGTAGDQSADSHGTEIAGIIAGRGVQRMVGLAPQAGLLDIPVASDERRVSVHDLVAGIEMAVSDGAEIINISLSIPLALDSTQAKALDSAVVGAWNAGRLVVASVTLPKGTNPSGETLLSFPAGATSAVAVAAIGKDGKRALSLDGYQPNYLYAPGADLFSTARGGGYAARLTDNGFAAAYASAAAALLWAADGLPAPQTVSPQQALANVTKVRSQLVGDASQGPGALNPLGAIAGLPYHSFPAFPVATKSASVPASTSAKPTKPVPSRPTIALPPPPPPGKLPWLPIALILLCLGAGAGGTRLLYTRLRRRRSLREPVPQSDWPMDVEWHP
jgi:subtilisin family serine protease